MGGGHPEWLQHSLEHLQELFVLEVNTVVKDEITARPAGSVGQSLGALVVQYEVAVGLEAAAIEQGPEAGTLAQLCARLERLHVVTDPHADGADQIESRRRIHSNTAELGRILAPLSKWKPGLKVEQDGSDHASLDAVLTERRRISLADVSRIRKMCDLGLEVVVFQTRVHLDGDVITRVAEDWHHNGDPTLLLNLHSQGVERGVSFWRSLGELAVDLLKLLGDQKRPRAE